MLNMNKEPAIVMTLTIGPTNDIGAAVVDKEGRVLGKTIFKGQNLISTIGQTP